GFGAKPDPGPLLAFAEHTNLSPARVAMVGDSTHDLIAGRRAGMQTVAVLTGVAIEAELAPHADVVLPNIGHIPTWVGA
ncbi:MAG: HAD-IA family hydrolase, partial [Pseudomonadota bacterium]|nr:HAD-IA family hydrolase [Pseudomonadota bacterium]